MYPPSKILASMRISFHGRCVPHAGQGIMAILVINAGSSSLKFSLFEGENLVVRGLVDRLGSSEENAAPHFRAWDRTGSRTKDVFLAAGHREGVLASLLDFLKVNHPDQRITAIGHRVVHGGDRCVRPTLVDESTIDYLESLVPLAPLHQPHALEPIRVLTKLHPNLPQVACFDTAFHATQSQLERQYALPREYFNRGVKKYGFHGLSYEYIASTLPTLDPKTAAGRTVVFHLGNGSSMCALKTGKSVASSMGFTALEGLVMGTRTGAIDPGVLLYLLQQEKMSVDEVANLLYKQSGLLGVSGLSADMRDLLASNLDASKEAIELYCYRAACELGRLAVILEGLDAVVFTAGIGEHAAPVRQRICERSAWLGVQLDRTANERNESRLHAPDSKVAVYIVPTNEELMIVRHVRSRLDEDANS